MKHLDVSEAASCLSDVVGQVASQMEPVILKSERGEAVIVPIEDYQLIQRLEDEENRIDLEAVRAAMRETGTIPWEVVKKEVGL